MINCLGGIEDTILYGESDDETDEASEVMDDQGAYTFAIMSDSGRTIGRYPDGTDSDDNSADFQTNMTPSPKASNDVGEVSEPDDGTNVDTPTGCGKNSAPSGDEEPSKCSYVGSLPSMLWMASLIVLFRRRE